MNSRLSGSTIQKIGNLASIASYFRLGSSKAQLELIRQVAVSQQQAFEKQTELKQLIFEMRHFLEKELPGIEDKVVARLKIDMLNKLIEDSRIGTPSFLEIPDKEYFSTTLELLKQASAELSPFEKEADLILSTLQRLRVVMKQLSLDRDSFLAELRTTKSTPFASVIALALAVLLLTLGLTLWVDPLAALGFLGASSAGGFLWFKLRQKDERPLLKKINECLEGYGKQRISRLDSAEVNRAFEAAEEEYSTKTQVILERHPHLEELLAEGPH